MPAGHKCSRLHGHSYRVEIALRGPVDPSTGWLVDFAVIDDAWAVLSRQLDHHNLNDVDGLDNPTCENLCAFIWKELKPKVPSLSAVMVERHAIGDKCTYRPAN